MPGRGRVQAHGDGSTRDDDYSDYGEQYSDYYSDSRGSVDRQRDNRYRDDVDSYSLSSHTPRSSGSRGQAWRRRPRSSHGSDYGSEEWSAYKKGEDVDSIDKEKGGDGDDTQGAESIDLVSKVDDSMMTKTTSGGKATLVLFLFGKLCINPFTNVVRQKSQTAALDYGIFLAQLYTMISTVLFSFAAFYAVKKGLVTPSQWKTPKYLFGILGFMDSATRVIDFVSQPMFGAKGGAMVLLLNQTLIPITMLLAFVITGKRYTVPNLLGAGIILSGVALFVLPKQLRGQGGGTFSIVGLILRLTKNIAFALTQIFQGKLMAKFTLDTLFLGWWVKVFGTPIGAIMSYIYFAIKDGPTSFFDQMSDGFKCLVGTGVGTVPTCKEGLLLWTMLFNIGAFIDVYTALGILKHGNPTMLVVVMTLCLPMTSIAFSTKAIMGDSATALNAGDIYGLIVVVAGVLIYGLLGASKDSLVFAAFISFASVCVFISFFVHSDAFSLDFQVGPEFGDLAIFYGFLAVLLIGLYFNGASPGSSLFVLRRRLGKWVGWPIMSYPTVGELGLVLCYLTLLCGWGTYWYQYDRGVIPRHDDVTGGGYAVSPGNTSSAYPYPSSGTGTGGWANNTNTSTSNPYGTPAPTSSYAPTPTPASGGGGGGGGGYTPTPTPTVTATPYPTSNPYPTYNPYPNQRHGPLTLQEVTGTANAGYDYGGYGGGSSSNYGSLGAPMTKLESAARAVGHINEVNFALQLLPIARNSVWGAVFGIPFDRLVRYHRWTGTALMVSTTTHALLWSLVFLNNGQSQVCAVKSTLKAVRGVPDCSQVSCVKCKYNGQDWLPVNAAWNGTYLYASSITAPVSYWENLASYNGFVAIQRKNWTIPLAQTALALIVIYFTLYKVSRLAIMQPSRFDDDSAPRSRATRLLHWVRRHMFEIFYYFHWSALLTFFMALTHNIKSSSHTMVRYILLALPLYFVDLAVRMYKTWRRAECVSVQFYEQDTIARIELRKTGFNFEPGQYLFLKAHDISRLQSHPFSISCSPGLETFTVHVRDNGPGSWTRSLLEKAMASRHNPSALALTVGGAYGKTSLSYSGYSDIVLIAGGIGVTAVISLFEDLYMSLMSMKKEERANLNQKIWLYWVVSNDTYIELFDDILHKIDDDIVALDLPIVMQLHITYSNNNGPTARKYSDGQGIADEGGPGAHIDVEMRDIRLDSRRRGHGRDQRRDHYPAGNDDDDDAGYTGDRSREWSRGTWQTGRPVWNSVFTQISNSPTKPDTRKNCGVFVCGPTSMSHELAQVCRVFTAAGKDSGERYDFHKERYRF